MEEFLRQFALIVAKDQDINHKKSILVLEPTLRSRQNQNAFAGDRADLERFERERADLISAASSTLTRVLCSSSPLPAAAATARHAALKPDPDDSTGDPAEDRDIDDLETEAQRQQSWLTELQRRVELLDLELQELRQINMRLEKEVAALKEENGQLKEYKDLSKLSTLL